MCVCRRERRKNGVSDSFSLSRLYFHPLKMKFAFLDCLLFLNELCFCGRFLAISNFPARRQVTIDKVRKSADALATELEEAMQKDLLETIDNIESFVKIVAQPYQDAAQQRVDRLLEIQHEISDVEEEIQKLNGEIQNLHVL